MMRATDLEQQASEWVIRSESGSFTPAMRAELERWLLQPRHRANYLRIREAWRRANCFGSVRPLDGNEDLDLLKRRAAAVEPPNDSGPPWGPRVATFSAMSFGACVVAFVAWVALGRSEWMSYTTGTGGYQQVVLADGSIIQLNTGSLLRTRFTPQQRQVHLIRGEALITTAGDARRPLTVTAANTTARTVPRGDRITQFSVRLRTNSRVDFAVAQGSITLEPAVRIIYVALGRDSPATATLSAGETATVEREGVQLGRLELEELNRKLSWTTGLLSFQGETLTEVTDEFNRYNRQQLIVADPNIAQRRIGGVFKATDPDSFVAALQNAFGVQADEQLPGSQQGTVILLRAAAQRRQSDSRPTRQH